VISRACTVPNTGIRIVPREMEGRREIRPNVAVQVGINLVPFGVANVAWGISRGDAHKGEQPPTLTMPASRSYTATARRLMAPPASS
jgi:hypothetical protein